MPSYANAGLPSDPLGSGDPYKGSGFTNFDKYLQDENIKWGAGEARETGMGDNFTGGRTFDNWMINVGHPNGIPPIQNPINPYPGPRPGSPPGTPDPTRGAHPTTFPNPYPNGPTSSPTPQTPVAPTVPPESEPATTPSPEATWAAGPNSENAPGPFPPGEPTPEAIAAAGPGSLRMPTSMTSSLQSSSAFPALDKKLQSGVW